MTASKPASSIFDDLDAAISAIDNVGEGRFGHHLGTESSSVHTTNILRDKGFRHFGQFEHLKQGTLGSEPPDVDRKTDWEDTTRGSRAKICPSQVPKVPKVPKNYIEQEFGVGHQPP